MNEEHYSPRPHQLAAISDVMAGFNDANRGQLIMACGTGKTLVGLWVAEKMEAKRICLVAPNIWLISQNIKEWRRHTNRQIEMMGVCSDETVGEARMHTSDLDIPVSTDPQAIKAFLDGPGIRVVFSTYQSSDKLAAAFAAGAEPFDLMLCDEAHHCATSTKGSSFSIVLDNERTPAGKRLFMTATPKVYSAKAKRKGQEEEFDILSMDDELFFGKVLHRLTFSAAIKAEILADYRVLVNVVRKKQVLEILKGQRAEKLKMTAKQIGLARAIQEHDIRHAIAYLSSIDKAKAFVGMRDDKNQSAYGVQLNKIAKAVSPKIGHIEVSHVHGEMKASRRSEILEKFAKAPGRSVLSNCKCLQEGVDVQAVDCVAFIDPRYSVQDITQAVGRAIRRSGDKVGTIVISVFCEDTKDLESQAQLSEFREVARVARALKSHDERIGDEIELIRRGERKANDRSGIIQFSDSQGGDGNIDWLVDYVASRSMEMAVSQQSLSYDTIRQWVIDHRNSTGSWPNQYSGTVLSSPSEGWCGVSQAMRLGGRGLGCEKSLSEFIESIFPPLELNADVIRDFAVRYFERLGSWPSHQSGYIDGSSVNMNPELSWTCIDQRIRNGAISGVASKSLSEFISKECGGRNLHISGVITYDIIRDAIRPIIESGVVPVPTGKEYKNKIVHGLGITWQKLDKIMREGGRGLPGRKSLCEFMQSEFGIAKRGSKKDITRHEIIEMGKEYFFSNGSFPKPTSGGAIKGRPGLKWHTIGKAFENLAIDKTLSGFIYSEVTKLINLEMIDGLIIKYKEENDTFPNGRSGSVALPIKYGIGVDWHMIDKCLRKPADTPYFSNTKFPPLGDFGGLKKYIQTRFEAAKEREVSYA